MIKRISMLGLAALIAAPTLAPAQGFLLGEKFTLPVAAIDRDSFEVVEANGAAGPQIWCAASIYMSAVLNQKSGDLFIETPRGASRTVAGRKAVTFTTAPQSGAFKSASFGTRQTGEVHSYAAANAVCRQFDDDVRIRIGSRTLRD